MDCTVTSVREVTIREVAVCKVTVREVADLILQNIKYWVYLLNITSSAKSYWVSFEHQREAGLGSSRTLAQEVSWESLNNIFSWSMHKTIALGGGEVGKYWMIIFKIHKTDDNSDICSNEDTERDRLKLHRMMRVHSEQTEPQFDNLYRLSNSNDGFEWWKFTMHVRYPSSINHQ